MDKKLRERQIVREGFYFEYAVLYNFLFIKESRKKYYRLQTFFRDHVTPKTESNHFIRVMADENSALDHMNKLYFICFTDY